MFTFSEFGVANIKISIFFNRENVFDFTHEENRIMEEIIRNLKKKISLVNFSAHYKIHDQIKKERKNFGVKKKSKKKYFLNLSFSNLIFFICLNKN